MQHTDGSFTAFDGLTLHRETWSPDEGDSNAVVIIVHGLGEHVGRYAHVAATLTAAGFTVEGFDLRGHGKSGGKRAYVKTYDEFMRDLVQFRELVEAEHPGEPIVLLGHSMGGNLAMGHALRHQDGLAGLALSGAALTAGDDFSPIQLKIFGLLAKVAPGIRPQGLDATSISRDPEVVAEYEADPLVYTGKISAGLGAALIGEMATFPTRYPTLRLPIWIGHGTEDKLAAVDGSRELERLATGSEISAHYYDGLYHEIFNEPEHDRVLADLVAWLGAVTV